MRRPGGGRSRSRSHQPKPVRYHLPHLGILSGARELERAEPVGVVAAGLQDGLFQARARRSRRLAGLGVHCNGEAGCQVGRFIVAGSHRLSRLQRRARTFGGSGRRRVAAAAARAPRGEGAARGRAGAVGAERQGALNSRSLPVPLRSPAAPRARSPSVAACARQPFRARAPPDRRYDGCRYRRRHTSLYAAPVSSSNAVFRVTA